MRKPVKCFYEVFDESKPHTVMDAGLRVIEVRRITGTLDKCGELDSDFRYIRRRDRAERSRWHRLHEAAKSYQFFPPIDTVFYRGEYYVVDGNRRVASAKALKIEFIDANVKEYVLSGDRESASGALSRRRFEIGTGLKNVILYNEAGYDLIQREIADRSKGGGDGSEHDLQASARRWYSEHFLPAFGEIERSELPLFYPDLAPGDIFVLILRFYREFMGGFPENVGFQTVISGYMFARKLPRRRAFRIFPFSALQSFLMRRSVRERLVPEKR